MDCIRYPKLIHLITESLYLLTNISTFPHSLGPDNHQSTCFYYFSDTIYKWYHSICLSLYSVQFSCSVVSDSLRPHELQHTRPPCSSPTPRVQPNPYPLSWWCHPAISSSVVPFSSCPQSLPASGSFPMSQLFAWGGQSIGVSALASFLPKKSQGWSPSQWAGWISL